MKKEAIVVMGPTGSGKSALALSLCGALGGLIINADRQQIYDTFPVLSAQPSSEDQKRAPHRLYGSLSAQEPLSAWQWATQAGQEIEQSFSQNQRPIIVGGTGFYIKTLVEGLVDMPEIPDDVNVLYDQRLSLIGESGILEEVLLAEGGEAHWLNIADTHRLARAWKILTYTGKPWRFWRAQPRKKPLQDDVSFTILVCDPPRDLLYERLNSRFQKMLETGAVDEVSALMGCEGYGGMPAFHTLGAPEIALYIKKELDWDTMVQQGCQSTRNYAKRQYTWCRHQVIPHAVIEDPERWPLFQEFLERYI